MQDYKIGTLIEDMGKVGIIRAIIDKGGLPSHCHTIIRWRHNYEIYYSDGVVGYLGLASMMRLIAAGSIRIIFTPIDEA
tara:strand:- start:2263 stop:2499 length:237 start_codon:yes stop_codon:yes gene_type:complete